MEDNEKTIIIFPYGIWGFPSEYFIEELEGTNHLCINVPKDWEIDKIEEYVSNRFSGFGVEG